MFFYNFMLCIAAALLTASPVFAASKKSTTAAPPKLSDEYVSRINLATEIPNPIERFKYKVIGTINGVTYYPTSVPLIDFENSETWKAQIGQVAVGSEIKLDIVQGFQGRIYYGVEIKKKDAGGHEITKIAWLDGMFVQIAGNAK